MNKEVTLVVRFFTDDEIITDIIDVFFDGEKAQQRAKELDKKASKGTYHGVINYLIVDADES